MHEVREINENTITDAVLEQLATTKDPRSKQIMEAAVRHLHAFAREVSLTPQEWLEGIKFLTAVGQKCTSYRQEFVLLSDTLGLSTLVNLMKDKQVTEHHSDPSVLGPYYRENSPQYKLGDKIAIHMEGRELCLYGRVTDAQGKSIPHASVQVWQTDEHGTYDMQRPGALASDMDLRGTFYTDDQGRYYFRSVLPYGYSIPMDGPVGDMIRAQGRHGYRPSHIHFLIGATGYHELVTALYPGDDPHVDSDTVFGVNKSLIIYPKENDPNSPFPKLLSVHYDFILAAASGDRHFGRVGVDPSRIIPEKPVKVG
jgi:hydroxyquinol 1,2-dioxygenase